MIKDHKKGGERYVDQTNLKIFSKSKSSVLFEKILHKIRVNTLFIIAKSIFYEYRYKERDFDDNENIYKTHLSKLWTLDNEGTLTLGPQTEIVKTRLKYNDSLDNLVKPADYVQWHKKFSKSFQKLLRQYQAFLDTIKPQVCAGGSVKDRKEFLTHQVRMKHLLAMFEKGKAFEAPLKPLEPSKKKMLVCLDGFIMEGKTAHLESYSDKDCSISLCEERSAWWRLPIQLDSKTVCLLDYSCFIMVPSIFEFMYGLGQFITSKHTTLYMDRTLMSASIFNGCVLMPVFQTLLLKVYNFEDVRCHFFRKLDYDAMPFPLYEHRKWEQEYYKNADKLKDCSRQFYSRFETMLQHLADVYPNIYTTIGNLDEFCGLDLEQKYNF